MALCVSDVLLLHYNTDIGACYIMLTVVIIKNELKVPAIMSASFNTVFTCSL